MVLYPAGVVSEMLLLYWGVPYVRSRDLYSIHMPNKWNFAWDYALFIRVRGLRLLKQVEQFDQKAKADKSGGLIQQID